MSRQNQQSVRLTLMLLFMLAFVRSMLADGGHISNGSFEQGLRGWIQTGGKFEVTKSPDAADGTHHARLAQSGNNATLAQRLENLESGKRYRAKIRVRQNTVSDARLIIRDETNAAYLALAKLESGTTWTEISTVFTAPETPDANTMRVRIEISFRGSGTGEVDNIIIEDIAARRKPSFPSTATQTPLHTTRILHVSSEGKADGDGSIERPFVRIQDGLNLAQAGDTVKVHPGIYYEYVSFKSSGQEGAPVTLEGMPGAIIDGDYRLPLNWQPAPELGTAVYKTKVSRPVFSVVTDNKAIMMLREDWARPGQAKTGAEWEWPKLFRNGIGGSRWDGVKALTIYLPDFNELIIRFKDELDPGRMQIATASADKNDALVRIDGFDHCVVRGLTLRNAAAGVRITYSRGTVVENCIIGPIDFGILLHMGSESSVIRFNEMFWNPYGGSDPEGEAAWDHWLACKRAGWLDRYGVEIRETHGGHMIHDNYVHNHWDGISARPYHFGLAAPSKIFRNRIESLCDDGLETAGLQEGWEWFDNILIRCRVAIRIKAPDTGPLYVYRNLFLKNMEDIRNYGEVELKPAVVYVYHNTCTSPAAISSNKVFGIGTPNYHFLNNLYHAEHWFLNQSKSIAPNWQANYNVYSRAGNSPLWQRDVESAAKLGLDDKSLWTEQPPGFNNLDAGDLSLIPSSVARNRGVDLSRYLEKPLPGCPPGYFKGTAPDAGALQYGQPMPDYPLNQH